MSTDETASAAPSTLSAEAGPAAVGPERDLFHEMVVVKWELGAWRSGALEQMRQAVEDCAAGKLDVHALWAVARENTGSDGGASALNSQLLRAADAIRSQREQVAH